MVALVLGAGNHQHPAVHVDHLDAVTVEAAEGVGLDDLGSGARRRTAIRQVHDAIHDRQQRVHVVRRKKDGDVLLGGDTGQQVDNLGGGVDVEVGQRLVEQQQLGADR